MIFDWNSQCKYRLVFVLDKIICSLYTPVYLWKQRHRQVPQKPWSCPILSIRASPVFSPFSFTGYNYRCLMYRRLISLEQWRGDNVHPPLSFFEHSRELHCPIELVSAFPMAGGMKPDPLL